MSWPFKPLGDILELSGRNRAGDQDLPVLSITMKHGLVDQADKFKKRVASSDTSNYRVAYKNELVVGFPIDEGVLGFQTKYPAGIVSPAYDIWKLRNEADSHIPYLERYLRSAQARASYASRMQGAVARRRSLTKTDFLNLEIPFPPLDDQIRIAYLLEKVEGLIAQRKQNLQQLDDLLKSVFFEMFGDPVRNDMGWPVWHFSELFLQPPRIGTTKPASSEGSIPVVRVGEIGGLRVRLDRCARVELSEQEFEKCKVERGDILLARAIGSQEQLGKASLIESLEEPLAFDSHVMRIRFDTKFVAPVFMYHWLRSSGGRRLFLKASGKTSVQFNINSKQISSIAIPLPPMPSQERFVVFAAELENLSVRYQQSLTDLEALYGALSQQAFKGELELSRMALPAAFIKGESPVVAAVPTPITTPVIELPETDLLLPALEDRAKLPPLLNLWLEAYCRQLGIAAFSVQDFVAAAQIRVAELHPEHDFDAGIGFYDLVKAWVFEALESGYLKQERNQINFIIDTRERVLGNVIELKVGEAR